MAIGRTRAVALIGLRGRIVEVESHLVNGLPQFHIVGTVDASLRESRSRVLAAAASVGVDFNQRKLTVNLTPAALPKRGPTFDVAIAVSALAAIGALEPACCERVVHVGELGLDGRLRPVAGVLPIVDAAVRAGFERVVVPAANAAEAALVAGASVIGATDLADVMRLHGADVAGDHVEAVPLPLPPTAPTWSALDMKDVLGQSFARRALEVAAAGGHHLLLIGPPGAGKSMLASRLPGLLPQLDDDLAVEVSAVHSLAGIFDPTGGLARTPPFEAPHHSASAASIVGGGPGIPLPGAMSRAHRGVLFLDEAPEFNRGVLEALRQPLEEGTVCVARSFGSITFPARFQLVMAANPCPCGYFAGQGKLCTCTPMQRRTYLTKLSGPVLDRLDLRVDVPAVRLTSATGFEESSAQIRARVEAARARQRRRFVGARLRLNADLTGPDLRGQFAPEDGATKELDRQLDRGYLSLRGYDRVLRVAWTLADLAGRSRPGSSDVMEAIQLRDTAVAA